MRPVPKSYNNRTYTFKDPEARLKARTLRASNGCLEWQGGRSSAGYGQFSFYGKVEYAHRVAWILEHGDIATGLEVCHVCDNPPCVEPTHLFLGTRTDNMRDMHNKGRGGTSLITFEIADQIRELYLTLWPREIAKKLNISIHVVRSVLWNGTWRR